MMEKVYFTGGIKTLNDPVFNVLRLLQEKENEIVDWIKKHEKYVEPLEKAWQEAVEQTLKEAKAKGK